VLVGRVITVLIVIAGLCLVPLVTADADTSPPGPVLSNFETYSGDGLARDCGFSQPVPGKPGVGLWLFCDTPVYGYNSSKQWALLSFIPGSTAAAGATTPGEVPTSLSELTSTGKPLPAFPNHDAPAQFLPSPTGLVTSTGGACTSPAYAASWIYGVTGDPAQPSDLLIVYDNFCVQSSFGFLPEGFGIDVYNPATNTVVSHTVYAADNTTGLTSPEVLGSPVVSGSYLYLYSFNCADSSITCPANPANAVYVARVPATPADWDNPADYQWYAGSSSWSSSPSAAQSVIPGVQPVGGVSAGDYQSLGQGFVLIVQTSIGGAFTVYEASSPAGPWQVKTSGTVPCTSGTTLCHALIGHPDLSTTSSLLISFLNPGAGHADGHVEVAAFPW
jgi:hypothetical protein